MNDVVTYNPDTNEATVRLSNSSINTWNTCKRKFYYNYIEGLVPRDRILVFDIGSLVHVGAAMYLRPTHAHFDQVTRYKIARQSIVEHWETEMAPLKVARDALNQALHVFPVIMRRRLDLKVIAVEQWMEHTFRHPSCPGLIVHLVGKADAISTDGKALYIEEHKTVSAMGFGDAKKTQYQKSRQTKGYVYLAQQTLKKSNVAGVVHNFFLKKKEPGLKQEMTYVGPRDIERYLASVAGVAEEIAHASQNNWFREELDSCHDWSGACPYSRLCEFGDNEEVRHQLFTKREKDERLTRIDTLAKREEIEKRVQEETVEPGAGVET